MTDENIQYLSQEKLDELKIQLETLKEVKITEIAKRIDEAKQLGDLSENAEYHSAREDMAWAQGRVREIENIVHNASVISNVHVSDMVSIGSVVTVKINGKKNEYTIVGAQEAEPISGLISNESPLGKAFLGCKKGDKVQVEIPAGVALYEIIEIK